MAQERSAKSAGDLRKWRARAAVDKVGAPSVLRTGAVFRLLAIMAVVAAAGLALLLYLRRLDDPVFLSIAVTEYTSPFFPPNPWAEQDSIGLLERFPHARKGYDSQTHSMLRSELEKTLSAGKNEPVVIHLSAHAMVRDGAIEILPGDAQPDDPSKRVLLKDLVRALRESPSANKLLILDIMQPVADARLGVLIDDVASQVHAELGQIDDGHLQILCACSPGQVSLAAQCLRQSVFGHYVQSGLAGLADGSNPENARDHRVTVHELARFVEARVDRWAADRLTRQTPVLLGNGADFELCRHGGSSNDKVPEPMVFPFAAEWDYAASWQSDGSYRLLPRQFRQLRAHLLRAEQRWANGGDLQRIQRELAAKTEDLKRQQKEVQQWLGAAAPAAAVIEAKTVDALKAALKKLDAPAAPAAAAKGKDDPPPKEKDSPVSRPKLREDAKKAARDCLTELQKAPGVVDFTRPMLTVLAQEENASWQKVCFAHELIRAGSPPSRVVGLMEKLIGMETDPEYWPGQAVKTAFRIALLEDNLAASEPWTLPWLAKLVQESSQLRREGEQLMCDVVNWKTAFPKALALLQQAEREYQGAPHVISSLIESRRICDESLAFLLDYVPFLLAYPWSSPRDAENDWTAAINQCQYLQSQFGRRPAGERTAAVESDINNLAERASELQTLMKRLMQPFSETELDRLIRSCPSSDENTEGLEIDRGAYGRIQAVLKAPFPSASKRKELWEALQRLEYALQRKTEAQIEAGVSALGPPDHERASRHNDERQRAAVRARVSLRLFELGGLEPGKLQTLRAEWRRVEREGDDLEAWRIVGQKLRECYAKTLVEQLDQEKDPRARAALTRVLHPFDDEHPERLPKEARYPDAWLRNKEVQDAKAVLKLLRD
jgi:hypothetical protein